MFSSVIPASAEPCLNASCSSSLYLKIHSQSQTTSPINAVGFPIEAEKHASVQNSKLVSCNPPFLHHGIFQKALFPFAASAALILYPSPANAGILSGFSGIESVPGPELPQVEFLSKWNEANQKKYAADDARFKESPLLKKLLEQSKLNKEKNQQSIQDKYCIRGAEWGVGDCSAAAMSPEDRENFIAMLKKKAGVE